MQPRYTGSHYLRPARPDHCKDAKISESWFSYVNRSLIGVVSTSSLMKESGAASPVGQPLPRRLRPKKLVLGDLRNRANHIGPRGVIEGHQLGMKKEFMVPT